jgi:hypothetical protein
MQTPEPEASDRRKLRPWQFSLRSLLILTGGVALLLGICQARALEPILQFCAIGVLFFQFYVLLVLAAGFGFPKGWGLARGISVSAVLAAYVTFGGRYLSPPNRSAHVVLLSASWLMWPSLAAMGWLIRRAASVEDRQAIRRSA